MSWVRMMGVGCLVLGASLAQAEDLRFNSCADASGRAVPVVADTTLAVLVASRDEGPRRVIRYNPELLPGLSDAARQFFFAHVCAKVPGSDSDAPGAEAALRRSRQADCRGLTALRASGLLAAAGAEAALQGELVFSPEQWALLPGPPRAVDFALCRQRGMLNLPRAATPSAGQIAWEACVRQCGDRLYRCQGAACIETYERCEVNCRQH